MTPGRAAAASVGVAPRPPPADRPFPRLLLLLLAALLAAAGGASPVARAAELALPALTGRVVDEAGVLPPEAERRLDALLAGYERTTGGSQLVVATLRSLRDLTIEELGVRLGREWAIGRAGRDDGALLLVAPAERRVRIEVGYGLEGRLTDALARTIIEAAILPRFRAGDLSGGIEAGARAAVEALGGAGVPPELTRPTGGYDGSGRASPGGSPLGALAQLGLMLLLAFFVLGTFGRRSRRRERRRARRGPWGRSRAIPPVVFLPPLGGGWGRGGGFGRGGGGFSGGGGGFGGGGASGSW